MNRQQALLAALATIQADARVLLLDDRMEEFGVKLREAQEAMGAAKTQMANWETVSRGRPRRSRRESTAEMMTRMALKPGAPGA